MHPMVIWWFPKIGVFPPKSSHFDRVFYYFHHPFWGTIIFGNIHFKHFGGFFVYLCSTFSDHLDVLSLFKDMSPSDRYLQVGGSTTT